MSTALKSAGEQTKGSPREERISVFTRINTEFVAPFLLNRRTPSVWAHLRGGGFMRVRLVGGALVIVGMFSSAPTQAASITFASQTVAPGETLRVDVFGVDLNDVVAFGFDLGFDASVLAFTEAVEGTFLSKVGPTSFAFCPDGSTDCPAELSSPSIFSVLFEGTASSTAADQPELLATLVFSVIAAGDAHLVLGSRLLGLQDLDLVDLPLTETAGTITSVPEPSTLALLGVGIAAIARKRLKRQTLG